MIVDNVVRMEVADNPLRSLKFLSVYLLLLEHLLLILSLLILQMILSLIHHIINILRLLIHSPSVINLHRLELVLVLVHQQVHFSVLLDLHPHLLDLCGYLTLQVVLQLARLLNVLCVSLDLLLDFSE